MCPVGISSPIVKTEVTVKCFSQLKLQAENPLGIGSSLNMDCYDNLGLQDYLTYEQTLLEKDKPQEIYAQTNQIVVITYQNTDQSTHVYNLVVNVHYLQNKTTQQMKAVLNQQIQYKQRFTYSFTIHFPYNCGPTKLILELHTNVYNYTNTYLIQPVNVYSSKSQENNMFSIHQITNQSSFPITVKPQLASIEESKQIFKGMLSKNLHGFIKQFQKRNQQKQFLQVPNNDSILLSGESQSIQYEKTKTQRFEKVVPRFGFTTLEAHQRQIQPCEYYLSTIPNMKDGKPTIFEGKVGQLLEYKLRYQFSKEPTLQCQYDSKTSPLQLVNSIITPIESKNSGIITLHMVSSEIGFQHLDGWYINFNNTYIDLNKYVFVKII